MASHRALIAVVLMCFTGLAGLVVWLEKQADDARTALLRVELESVQRSRIVTAGMTTTPAANNVASEREQIEFQIIAKKAMIDDLNQQMRKYREERQQQLKNDPVCAELQKCIEPLEKEADQKRSNPQAYSPDDILRATETVCQQRAVLCERQLSFGDDDAMVKWFQWEMMNQTSELAELRVLANYTDERGKLFGSSDLAPIQPRERPANLKAIDDQSLSSLDPRMPSPLH